MNFRSESKKFRAAVIGCGMIGTGPRSGYREGSISNHAAAWVANEDSELVAVCDVNSDLANFAAERWRLPSTYGDFRRLLEVVRPEIVSICTPNQTHGEILDACLRDSVVEAILMEKPMSMDAEQAATLALQAEERGKLLVVNYSRRYSPGHRRIKMILESGELGSIQSVNGYYTKGILHNGTHWIDLCRYLIGEFSSVTGHHARLWSDGDYELDAMFEFQTGARGNLCQLDSRSFSIFEMDILGTLGRIRISQSGHLIEWYRVAESPYYSGYQALELKTSWDGEMDQTILNATIDLTNCLKRGGAPVCTGHDGSTAVAIAQSLIRSAKVGERVFIR